MSLTEKGVRRHGKRSGQRDSIVWRIVGVVDCVAKKGIKWKTDLSWEVEAFVVAEISTRLARPSESPILDAGRNPTSGCHQAD